MQTESLVHTYLPLMVWQRLEQQQQQQAMKKPTQWIEGRCGVELLTVKRSRRSTSVHSGENRGRG